MKHRTITVLNRKNTTGTISVIDFNGNQLWSGKDVCQALEIKDHKQALGSVWSEYKIKGGECVQPLSTGKKIHPDSILLNEFGVYQLIFKSRKDEAVRFQKWVFESVLPSIRKFGKYIAPEVQHQFLNWQEQQSLTIENIPGSVGRGFKSLRARYLLVI